MNVGMMGQPYAVSKWRDTPGLRIVNELKRTLTGRTNTTPIESVYHIDVEAPLLVGLALLCSTCFLSSCGSLEDIVLGLRALFGRHWGGCTVARDICEARTPVGPQSTYLPAAADRDDFLLRSTMRTS